MEKVSRETVRLFIETKAGCYVEDGDTFAGLRIGNLEKQTIVDATVKEFAAKSADLMIGKKPIKTEKIETVGQLIDAVTENFED